MPSANRDEEIARMSAWLKRNGMVGQTTLAGKLTLTPKIDLLLEQELKQNGSPGGTKSSL